MKKIIKSTLSILFWIAVWEIVALAVNNHLLLPAPLSVLLNTFSLACTSEFWQIVLLSLARILAGIVLSVVLGIFLAVISSVSDIFKSLVDPLVSVMKSTPVASFIMLALLWLDRDVIPVFITALIVIPTVYSNLTVGISKVDKNLLEMTNTYNFSFLRKLKRLYLPSVYPYFLSACKSSLGLAWKAGIAAEVLAVPAFSIGKMIYNSKIYLETIDLFSWTFVVIILSVTIEYVLCMLLERLGDKTC